MYAVVSKTTPLYSMQQCLAGRTCILLGVSVVYVATERLDRQESERP